MCDADAPAGDVVFCEECGKVCTVGGVVVDVVPGLPPPECLGFPLEAFCPGVGFLSWPECYGTDGDPKGLECAEGEVPAGGGTTGEEVVDCAEVGCAELGVEVGVFVVLGHVAVDVFAGCGVDAVRVVPVGLGEVVHQDRAVNVPDGCGHF